MSSEQGGLPLVSVCIPVRNGAERLGRCLASLRALDWPQDRLEIIIADGMSVDATADVAAAHGAIFLPNPKQIVASGRNIAFATARGDYIASTDDDCVVPANWLKTALKAFEDPDAGAVGGISYLPKSARPWARAVNYVFRLAGQAGYSVQSDYLPSGSAEDLPGCNTVYRAEAWRRAGPFNEDLVTAEDVEFHQRIRDCGMTLTVAPDLYVWHDKRSTPAHLFRQIRRFAEGRVQLDRIRPGALRVIHKLMGWGWIYGPALAGLAFFLLPFWPLLAALLALWLAAAGKALQDGERLAPALLVGPALATVTLGWSTGFLKERFLPMVSAAGR